MTATEPGTGLRARVRLRVDGMTCAACADRVRRALERRAGTHAEVNLLTGIAEIDAPVTHRAEDFCHAVEAAGYTATPATVAPVGVRPPVRLGARAVTAAMAAASTLGIAALPETSTLLPVPLRPWLILILGATAVLGAAAPIHAAAWRAARRRRTTMDTLTSLGLLGTLGYATAVVCAGVTGAGHPVVVAGVTAIALTGRHLERRAEQRAAVAHRDLTERTARRATVLRGTEPTDIPARLLRSGDRLLIGPGDAVAADGLVLEGAGRVDSSALTGTPSRLAVGAGDAVTTGGVLVDGTIVVEVATDVGATSRQGTLTYRSDFQQLADRVAGIFVPAVLITAGITVLGWLLAGAPWPAAVAPGLAVLLAACPCALGLATPIALQAATARAAQLGVLLEGHRVLERADIADSGAVVVFDKTGTLTERIPETTAIVTGPGMGHADVLRLAAAVEAASSHPIATALTTGCRTAGLTLPRAEQIVERPGLGVLGSVAGQRVAVGRARWLRTQGFTVSGTLGDEQRSQEQDGHSVVFVGVGDRAVAIVAVAERIRPSAAPAVAALRRLGLRPLLLTGDNPYSAQAVADRTGIDDVVAEVMPEDKAEIVRRLQATGRQVVVVGDGSNDRPALAAADLGVTLDDGTDEAAAIADLVVPAHDLTRIPAAIGLADATVATIRTGLRWALGYNLIIVPLAAVALSPLVAAAAMACSSIFLVTHSLRLRRYRPPDNSWP
ncbi:cation-translocating P-type ATPase [Nocardia sp. NPDC050710]|uniref:heavy metal translocating P-type ATPase n=1 Tax=Nocardia sp. NPDC050710 TaxID=3157220 RepID=UPI0033DBAD7F